MQQPALPPVSSALLAPVRTCVGCGRRDTSSHLVRLVAADDGSVNVDLGGRVPGRGAHLHAAAVCIASAARRGLARSFRRPVRMVPSALSAAVVQAAHDRAAALILHAAASGGVVVDRHQVLDALSDGTLPLVVVAADAPCEVLQGEVAQAVAHGRAVCWGTCALLGALARREPLAMLGIRSKKLGDDLAQACRIADGARTGAEVR
jgi:predicted RNA-binding protein YlxR (DUF448 family)